MQKARGNHCIKKISQVSVVHENYCKSILTTENNKRERERDPPLNDPHFCFINIYKYSQQWRPTPESPYRVKKRNKKEMLC
jgi:hypothetical protein